MERKDIYSLATLAVLTTLTALFSNSEGVKYVAFIILALSGIKFILVSFQFMELKKAHNTWKVLLLSVLLIFIITISIIVI
jgi:heme/copper-type cytochrome/quinol oxidase subunit 4